MKNRRKFTKEIALGLTAGAVALAGCAGASGGNGNGGGSTTTGDTVTDSGPIPAELISKATGDDAATVYGATGSSNAVDMIDGLSERFPFASAEYVQMGDSKIASRLTSELRTNEVTADALFSSGRGAKVTLVEETDTLRQNPDYLIDMFEELEYPEEAYGDYHYPLNVFPIVTYYNTNRISESELPNSYWGMIEDRFDGEIVMETPTVPGGNDAFLATLEAEWGTETFEEWANGLLDNNLQETDSGGAAYAEIANGNNMIGFGLIDDVVRARKEGEPNVDIAWKSMHPHAVELQFPGALVNESPNQGMGELFAAFTASREGQEIIASWGAFPALPEVKAEAFPDLIPEDYSFETGVFNVDGYYTQVQEQVKYLEDLGFGI